MWWECQRKDSKEHHRGNRHLHAKTECNSTLMPLHLLPRSESSSLLYGDREHWYLPANTAKAIDTNFDRHVENKKERNLLEVWENYVCTVMSKDSSVYRADARGLVCLGIFDGLEDTECFWSTCSLWRVRKRWALAAKQKFLKLQVEQTSRPYTNKSPIASNPTTSTQINCWHSNSQSKSIQFIFRITTTTSKYEKRSISLQQPVEDCHSVRFAFAGIYLLFRKNEPLTLIWIPFLSATIPLLPKLKLESSL